MTKVLAAIANDSRASAVLVTARAIAQLCSGTVEALHVGDDADAEVAEAARHAGVTLHTAAGQPVAVLVHASLADEVAAVVLGAPDVARSPRRADSTALQLITVLEKPVVLVPRDGATGREISRILVPLDGTAGSAVALDELVQLAADATVEIVVAHVHEERALPAFSDHLAHEVRAWSEEFLARNCPSAPDATLELRVGEPHENVLDILRHSGCDLVALGWSQDLAAGRAAVVRRLLADSPVPVLLVPANPGAAISRPAADADPGGV